MSIRIPSFVLSTLLLLAPGPGAAAPELRVEIQEPAPETLVPETETHVEVVGGASIYGGVRYLDLMLLIDTSKSLRATDPKDRRTAGTVALVRSLPNRGDIRVGVVDFDGNSEMLSPLTTDRQATIAALEGLDQYGTTDIAGAIQTALAGFEASPRVGASRVILLFTDGKSDVEEARVATAQARQRGVAVHTLLLGADEEGEAMLQEIADATGGSFLRVTDPEKLPDAFMNLRTTGVDSVIVRVDGSAPVAARLEGGRFRARVPVSEGRNRIVATAVSLAGETRDAQVDVLVSAGCGELEVAAVRDGAPAVSVSKRSIEFVFDASNSMWGRMQGEPKISVAKKALDDALGWLPEDLALGLRVYGHQHAHAKKNCQDSELMVPLASGDRDSIRQAIQGFRPRGQTPLAYAIEQAGADLAKVSGERAVVLVTDGIESCGGDPAAAARALQSGGPVPIHVIGFGLGDADEDRAALRAIAEASGGKFVTAGSAAELRQALEVTAGTTFAVMRGQETVARGSLGVDRVIPLAKGDYTLRLESEPPYEVPVSMTSRQGLKLTLEPDGERLRLARSSRPIEFRTCETDVPEGIAEGITDGEAFPAAPAPTH